MSGSKRILATLVVALLVAGGGSLLAVCTKAELAGNLLGALGFIVSLATTVYFQVLRRVEEAREKVLLDQPHAGWFRRKLDARKSTLFRRWIVSASLGLVCIGVSVALKTYPLMSLLVIGFAALGIAMLCVVLMAVEFKMISDLFAKLQDDAEKRKQKHALDEKINAA